MAAHEIGTKETKEIGAKEIGTGAQLPLSVAIEIVVQGLRIRLGRSMVTLAGVVCGIAFLSSVVASSVIKGGVADENAARNDAARMVALIESETGPMKGKPVAVLVGAEPNDGELRLIAACTKAGAELSSAGNSVLGLKHVADLSTAVTGATAVIVVGPPPATLSTLMTQASRPVVAGLQSPLSGTPGVISIALAYAPKPEEMERASTQAQEEKARGWWVTGIALAVTAIGITNAMLMSVTERFREIGTMKCLGALSSFIRRIFFLESAFMGLLGGIVGAVAGALITVVGYGFSFGFALVFAGTDWTHLTIYSALTVIASVLLATAAAIYPASVASRMRPSAALRSSV